MYQSRNESAGRSTVQSVRTAKSRAWWLRMVASGLFALVLGLAAAAGATGTAASASTQTSAREGSAEPPDSGSNPDRNPRDWVDTCRWNNGAYELDLSTGGPPCRLPLGEPFRVISSTGPSSDAVFVFVRYRWGILGSGIPGLERWNPNSQRIRTRLRPENWRARNCADVADALSFVGATSDHWWLFDERGQRGSVPIPAYFHEPPETSAPGAGVGYIDVANSDEWAPSRRDRAARVYRRLARRGRLFTLNATSDTRWATARAGGSYSETVHDPGYFVRGARYCIMRFQTQAPEELSLSVLLERAVLTPEEGLSVAQLASARAAVAQALNLSVASLDGLEGSAVVVFDRLLEAYQVRDTLAPRAVDANLAVAMEALRAARDDGNGDAAGALTAWHAVAEELRQLATQLDLARPWSDPTAPIPGRYAGGHEEAHARQELDRALTNVEDGLQRVADALTSANEEQRGCVAAADVTRDGALWWSNGQRIRLFGAPRGTISVTDAIQQYRPAQRELPRALPEQLTTLANAWGECAELNPNVGESLAALQWTIWEHEWLRDEVALWGQPGHSADILPSITEQILVAALERAGVLEVRFGLRGRLREIASGNLRTSFTRLGIGSDGHVWVYSLDPSPDGADAVYSWKAQKWIRDIQFTLSRDALVVSIGDLCDLLTGHSIPNLPSAQDAPWTSADSLRSSLVVLSSLERRLALTHSLLVDPAPGVRWPAATEIGRIVPTPNGSGDRDGRSRVPRQPPRFEPDSFGALTDAIDATEGARNAIDTLLKALDPGIASLKRAQVRQSVADISIPLRQRSWVYDYITPATGVVWPLSDDLPNGGLPYLGLQIFGWANDVENPMWSRGPADWRRLFGVEIGLALRNPGDWTGAFGENSPAMTAGVLLHPLPYVTASAGTLVASRVVSETGGTRRETAFVPYAGLAVEANLPGLIANLVESRRRRAGSRWNDLTQAATGAAASSPN